MAKLRRPERPTTIEGVSDFRRPYAIGRVKIGEVLFVCRKCGYQGTFVEERDSRPAPKGEERPRLICPECGNANMSDAKTKVFTRPAKLDFFRIVPDDDGLLPLIVDQYGEEPKSLAVRLPFYVPITREEPDPFIPVDRLREAVFPQALTHFVKSGMICTGDGKRAVRYDEVPTGKEIDCPFEECPDFVAGKCSPSARLFLHLYRVPEFGSFIFSTRSWNSIVDINTGIDYVYAVAKQIADISVNETLASLLSRLPLILKIKEGSGKDEEGKTTRYSKVSIGLDPLLLSKMAEPEIALVAPTPTPAPVAAIPAATPEAAAYIESDEDARRKELLIAVKSAPPYTFKEMEIPDSGLDFDDYAKIAAEGKAFTERITGRRVALNHLTTAELEKIHAAQNAMEETTVEPPAEPDVDAEPPDEPPGMYEENDVEPSDPELGEKIRQEEVDRLNEIVEKLNLKPKDLAPIVNERLGTNYQMITSAVTKSWSVDTLSEIRERLEFLFADQLKKLEAEGKS